MQSQLQQLIAEQLAESERLHEQHGATIEATAVQFQSQLERMLPALPVQGGPSGAET